MIVKLNRTVTDFCGLSPFGSVTDRRTGPDFLRTVRLGAKGRQGRIQRTGADRGTGYCTPLTGGAVRSGPLGPPGELGRSGDGWLGLEDLS